MTEILDRYVSGLDEDGTWRALTTLPEKFARFQTETPFRESWRTAVDVLGGAALPLFQRLAILTLKPDAVLSRKADAVLDYLLDHGFLPVHAETFRYTRSTTRDLWRNQWNVATLDRIEVSDLVHYRTDAMTVFLLDTSDPLDIPAAPRLTRLKGSAFPADREEFHLRYQLGAPNRVMVLVHCPDEPADIVRELGVVFDTESLTRIYAALGRALRTGTPADLSGDIDKLYAGTEAVSLSVADAVAEFTVDIARRGRAGDADGQAAAARVLDALSGPPLDWRAWSADVRRCGIDVTDWIPTLVASHHIQHDLPDAKTLIRETGRRRWLAGEGLMVR
ncbi:hypothetical protein [Actinokineospora sp.]|uniref:hypothetical protein n=1 Tax=Actinokineospora sp. TaxID=1872133 RepID=UPI0040383AB3